MKRKLTLSNLILLIEEKHRFSCHQLLAKNAEKISIAFGSSTKHQAWLGGFKDHLEETMNFAILLYKLMNKQRTLPFSLSDVLLVLLLHDIEKPFKYTSSDILLATDEDKWHFLQNIVKDYGFILNENHWNALKYVHGEVYDYSPTERLQGPLAAFVHMCDVASARIWFDYPRK